VFSRFLKDIKSNPLYPTISMMVLRSMKKAVYDSTKIGHFGLAKKYYAHFTSPIRRYPDLTLHRQLMEYIAKRSPKVSPALLARWAEHASERETVATEAERALADIKKFKFLKEQVESRHSRSYDAVVSKVMPFGCFVDIPEIAVSGLVHISLLSTSYLRYNESDCTLSAPGGVRWQAGDTLKVVVGHVDLEARKVDFIPVFDEDSRCGKRRFRR
jgi:ribonuclease R